MTTDARLKTCSLLLALAPLAGCLSSGPPAPPVRWFDPTAAFGPVEPRSAPVAVTLRAQPHLSQDIAVRTSPYEVAFDADHRWLLPPEEVLRRAFVRCGAPLGGGGVAVELTAFELLDLGSGPAARVACLVHRPGDAALPPVRFDETVASAGDDLTAWTAAIAQASLRLAQRVLDLRY